MSTNKTTLFIMVSTTADDSAGTMSLVIGRQDRAIETLVEYHSYFDEHTRRMGLKSRDIGNLGTTEEMLALVSLHDFTDFQPLKVLRAASSTRQRSRDWINNELVGPLLKNEALGPASFHNAEE
jgi:hypothetical protein